MSYKVVAGYVTVTTEIKEGSRADVDIPRGASLPDDVPAEQVETLLLLKAIEKAAKRAAKAE